jgi:hypothetical protein
MAAIGSAILADCPFADKREDAQVPRMHGFAARGMEIARTPTDIVGAVVDQEWENTLPGSAAVPTLERSMTHEDEDPRQGWSLHDHPL